MGNDSLYPCEEARPLPSTCSLSHMPSSMSVLCPLSVRQNQKTEQMLTGAGSRPLRAVARVPWVKNKTPLGKGREAHGTRSLGESRNDPQRQGEVWVGAAQLARCAPPPISHAERIGTAAPMNKMQRKFPAAAACWVGREQHAAGDEVPGRSQVWAHRGSCMSCCQQTWV